MPALDTGRRVCCSYLSNQRETGRAELLPATPVEKNPRSLMGRAGWVLRRR